jgi:hypothetical protein
VLISPSIASSLQQDTLHHNQQEATQGRAGRKKRRIPLDLESPGCTFERNLWTFLATKLRRGRANDAESQPPKARNHVSELMRIVGV